VADVILDPGFGFSKTLQQNYELMARLPDLCRLFQDNAVLVGVSRKSMVYRLLGTSPEEALNGTTVLNTLALQAGARILRVHDVRAAVEAVRIHHNVLTH
jgi:dihydropteroate synthase